VSDNEIILLTHEEQRMFFARHKINEMSPGDSVNDYATRFANHFLWFLIFELGAGIVMPIVLLFVILADATGRLHRSIDSLVEPRDIYLLFAGLLCGHIAEIAQKRRTTRFAMAILLLVYGIMFWGYIRASELVHTIGVASFANTWLGAVTYALVAVGLITSTIALPENKDEPSTERAPS
jgi:hypothetical protein